MSEEHAASPTEANPDEPRAEPRSRWRLYVGVAQLLVGAYGLCVGAVDARWLVIGVGIVTLATGVRSVVLYRRR